MSFKYNIVANYISQLYVTFIGIVILPLYIKYMGAEAYGLIGFFTMLQAWFNVLDMGLTPTMARETARFHGGALDALSYRQFVRTLEGLFLGVAFLGGAALYFSSGYIANNWLQASEISASELQIAIQLMAIIVSLRWLCGLYRGAISGSEKLVWLSGYNSLIATLRFIGVLPILTYIDATPSIFFSYQLGVALIELVGLVFFSYQLFPSIQKEVSLTFTWSALKPSLKFSLTIAFSAFVWVLITQIDKLILSKILPLAEFGYYTLAVLVAGGILIINGPISLAIMPRMARLEAEGNHSQIINIYRKSTQLVTIIVGSISITLFFFAEPFLWAWTGDEILAKKVAPILMLYAVGNGILAISTFPYYLQYAKGDLHLHLIGNVIFVVVLTPLIIWATKQYGGIGAGYVWLGMNLLVYIIWIPFIHERFSPGLNKHWYFEDTIIIFLPALIVGYLIKINFVILNSRGWVAVELIIIGTLLILSSFIASTKIREIVILYIRKLIKDKNDSE